MLFPLTQCQALSANRLDAGWWLDAWWNMPGVICGQENLILYSPIRYQLTTKILLRITWKTPSDSSYERAFQIVCSYDGLEIMEIQGQYSYVSVRCCNPLPTLYDPWASLLVCSQKNWHNSATDAATKKADRLSTHSHTYSSTTTALSIVFIHSNMSATGTMPLDYRLMCLRYFWGLCQTPLKETSTNSWPSNQRVTIKDCKMKRVMFGVVSSSFLAS